MSGDITSVLADTVQAAVHQALDTHTPRLTYTAAEAGQLLGVSPRHIRKALANGLLVELPDTGATHRITTASILAYAGWPVSPARLAAPLHTVPEAEVAS